MGDESILKNLANEARLFVLLVSDRRVPWLARGALSVSLLYLIGPVDLIPNSIPVFGYADQVGILWLGYVIARRLMPAELLLEYPPRTSNASLKPENEVWVLADERIGSTCQSLAVAERLCEGQGEDNGLVEVSVRCPSGQIAAVECQQIIVRQDSIAFSAIPKHASFYVQTAEIPLAILEAAIVPPVRA